MVSWFLNQSSNYITCILLIQYWLWSPCWYHRGRIWKVYGGIGGLIPLTFDPCSSPRLVFSPRNWTDHVHTNLQAFGKSYDGWKINDTALRELLLFIEPCKVITSLSCQGNDIILSLAFWQIATARFEESSVWWWSTPWRHESLDSKWDNGMPITSVKLTLVALQSNFFELRHGLTRSSVFFQQPLEIWINFRDSAAFGDYSIGWSQSGLSWKLLLLRVI